MKKIIPKLKIKYKRKEGTKTPLTATFIYDEKIAKSFHHTRYYYSSQNRVNNIVKIEDIKQAMSTQKTEEVTKIFDK